MNYFAKTLMTLSTLLLAYNVHAAQSPAGECPPISTIEANSTFIFAGGSAGDVWTMFSDKFEYQNTPWNIVLVGTFPDISTDAEAIQKGNEFVKTKITLSEPIRDEDRDYTLCVYAYDINKTGFYFLGAVNPPALPGDLARFTKLLR